MLIIMDKLEVGSVVWLKSGGPAMTVQRINSNSVECVWFIEHDHHEPKIASLLSVMLTTINSNKQE